MSHKSNWWALQFVEGMKDLSKLYEQFCTTREITYLDEAEHLCEQLNEAYEMTLDLKDYVEFGGAMIASHTPPQFRNKDL